MFENFQSQGQLFAYASTLLSRFQLFNFLDVLVQLKIIWKRKLRRNLSSNEKKTFKERKIRKFRKIKSSPKITATKRLSTIKLTNKW